MADHATSVPAQTPALPDIIQRYLNGESMVDLAKDSAVHPRTLYRWMLTECGPAYDQIITECLSNRIADADVLLMESTDSCQVARARELAKFARMDFERRRPKLYGPKQEIEVDNKISVTIQRYTPQPVVVESGSAEALSGEVKQINELGSNAS